MGNLGLQAAAHCVGFVGVFIRNRWACRRYFHYWIVLVVWIPLDSVWYGLMIWHDMNYYHATYKDTTWNAVEQGVAIAKLSNAVLAVYFMLVVWSHHENLEGGKAALNDEGECVGETPPKKKSLWGRVKMSAVKDLSLVDEDEQLERVELADMEAEKTSLEWLQETDPSAMKQRRKGVGL